MSYVLIPGYLFDQLVFLRCPRGAYLCLMRRSLKHFAWRCRQLIDHVFSCDFTCYVVGSSSRSALPCAANLSRFVSKPWEC